MEAFSLTVKDDKSAASNNPATVSVIVKAAVEPPPTEVPPPALEFLEREWKIRCDQYLPLQKEIWCFNTEVPHEYPKQGWKLHVSATVFSASDVLDKIYPILYDEKIVFKGPRSINILKKLNCGLFYNFSQVGKFVTVYCTPSKRIG
jgi:hypothetical protein